MKLELSYLKGIIPVTIPEGVEVEILEPNDLVGTGHGSAAERVRKACDFPLDSLPLEAFLEGGSALLVIINDATRPTPTASVLDAIADSIDKAGTRFIVATGAHREPTDAEYRQILGRHYDRFREKCIAHVARNKADLIEMGTTRNGTPIILNKAVLESDRVIAIGSVEPHYFAGYTGGRKAFLPGVAGYATIEANHKLALSDMARSCELLRNPVSQDMDDALDLIQVPVFSIMTVLDKDQELAWCSAGDIRTSFTAAVEKADAIFTVPLRKPADLVISVARYPMDIDLYQSQKAIDNGSLAMKDGGVLLVISSCRDGVGDTAFLELLGSARTPEAVFEKIANGYRLGYHKAAKILLVARRGTICAKTELPGETLEKAFIRPCPDVQSLINEVVATRGTGIRIVCMPDGTVTVPRVLQDS